MSKRLLSLFLLTAALAISAAEPRVSRTAIAGAEKSFDGRIVGLWHDALALVGPTRGVYLDGYGVVLTAEINVAMPPISLMNPKPTPKQMVELHKFGILYFSFSEHRDIHNTKIRQKYIKLVLI